MMSVTIAPTTIPPISPPEMPPVLPVEVMKVVDDTRLEGGVVNDEEVEVDVTVLLAIAKALAGTVTLVLSVRN